MKISQKAKLRTFWGRNQSPLEQELEKSSGAVWTILMADDDPDDFYLVRDALKEAGLQGELRLVSDGVELMDYLFARGRFAQNAPRPSLILLDLNMPRRGGRETLREIKANPNLKGIPVVVYTTSKDANDVSACYDYGADSFITKPSSFESLVETMATLGKHWLGADNFPALAQ